MKNIVIKRYPMVDILTNKCTDVTYSVYKEDGKLITVTNIDGLIDLLKKLHEDKVCLKNLWKLRWKEKQYEKEIKKL